MSNSARIGLPLLDAAQAQKHVTVNESFVRLDVVAAGQVQTVGQTAPPATPTEGEAHIVAAIGATGAWIAQEGNVAVFLNGGWDFISPWAGWELWAEDGSGMHLYDGAEWRPAGQSISPGGALTAFRIAEIDHSVTAGATSESAAFIPDKAIVLGVTARVFSAIGGATSWSLGVSGSPDRYGSGFGVAVDAFAHGVTGSPLTYFGGSTLLLTAAGGDFTGGTVRISAHYLDIAPPRAG